ncbi:MAG TPA: helix-turn-helix domain-containing protein [Candidatus Norongarragalinales archaeon]|nr:helix-turn-helix domain-containing protein [Candidatus Norongarragalinales archaeon]
MDSEATHNVAENEAEAAILAKKGEGIKGIGAGEGDKGQISGDERSEKATESPSDAGDTYKNHLSVGNIDIMQNPQLQNQLRNLGLNQYEAQAYLALSLGGVNTAGDIAEVGKIARPRVYDVLDKLQEKGFAAIKAGRPVKYAAVPIIEAIQTLKKHKETALMEELSKIEELGGTLKKGLDKGAGGKKFDVEESVWTLKGRNSIYSRIGDMLSNAKNVVVVNSHPDGVVEKIKSNIQHFEKARARGVKIHVVSPISEIQDKRHALHSSNSQVAKIAHTIIDRKLPTRMVLADDEAMIFLTNPEVPAEEEVGLWMKNAHMASTLREIALKGKD